MNGLTGLRAILPVKPLAEGKSRLAGVLAADDRIALNRRLFRHVLEVLCLFPGAARTTVLTGDSAVMADARDKNVATMEDIGGRDLNHKLHAAIARSLVAESLSAILIVPADLPHLAAEHVRMLVDACPPMGIAIAPDRRENGTNGLVIRPPGLIACAFGEASFSAHIRRAARAGGTVRVVRAGGLGFDVDTPSDFAAFNG